MTEPRRVDVLLVGGGVAAARCARRLRREGFGGSILLVGEEEIPPYNRPPLSKELLAGSVPEDLVLAEAEGWYARKGIELVLGVGVATLDAGERRATLADGSEIAFGSCLLATGAEPLRPPIPGAEHAAVLRRIGDATALHRAAIDAVATGGAGAQAAVVGGGFIGVEAAASLAGLGLRVTLVERTAQLWSGALGETVAGWARRRLEVAGVRVRLGTSATALEPDGLIAGERLPASVILVGVGVRPRVELAEAAGLAVDDGIVVDANRAVAPGILAAGDVARVPYSLAGAQGIRVEHWHAAREGGEAVALAILGRPVPPPRAPWVYSEFGGQLLDVVGWAPAIEDEVVLGDASGPRFAVAHVAGGRVAQLAVANGYVPVDVARRFVEASPSVSELGSLLPA